MGSYHFSENIFRRLLQIVIYNLIVSKSSGRKFIVKLKTPHYNEKYNHGYVVFLFFEGILSQIIQYLYRLYSVLE